MKEQYIGDVKDYGKFRLLNVLCESTGLMLGVNWYLTRNDETAQGRYGNIPSCDDSLYQKVVNLKLKKAGISDVERSGILPLNVTYYSRMLEYSDDRITNARQRALWHKRAVEALSQCDVVFLDPDTGIITDDFISKDWTCKESFYIKNDIRDGTRYVTLRELADYLNAGKSLIVFQYGMRTGIDTQLRLVYARLNKYLSKPDDSFVFRYSNSPGEAIAFICLYQPKHQSIMLRFRAELLDKEKPWSRYFALWMNEGGAFGSSPGNAATQPARREAPSPDIFIGARPEKPVSPQDKLRDLIMSIPKGKVTTYGWLSMRIYGTAAKAQPILSMIKKISAETAVPCHRVVSSDGLAKAPDENYGNTGKTQRQLLLEEGVPFIGLSAVDLQKSMCKP